MICRGVSINCIRICSPIIAERNLPICLRTVPRHRRKQGSEQLSLLQKIKHRKAHPHIPHNKCMWNKKYKGYRFKSICNKLEVNFKSRHKFLSKMGGYKDARSDDKSE